MKTHPTVAEAQAQSERAPCSAPHGAVVASARACPVCGTPLHGRQESCSARCRAAKSRRARIPVRAEELRALRALLRETVERVSEIKADATVMLESLWEATAALDRYVGP